MSADRMILRVEISLTGRPKAFSKYKISAARKRAFKSEMGCDDIYERGSVVLDDHPYMIRIINELHPSNAQDSVFDNSILGFYSM